MYENAIGSPLKWFQVNQRALRRAPFGFDIDLQLEDKLRPQDHGSACVQCCILAVHKR